MFFWANLNKRHVVYNNCFLLRAIHSSGFAEEDSGKQNPPSQLIRVLETNRSIQTYVRILQSYFLFRIMNLQFHLLISLFFLIRKHSVNRSPTLDEDDVAEDFEKDEFTLREIINVKVSDFFLLRNRFQLLL